MLVFPRDPLRQIGADHSGSARGATPNLPQLVHLVHFAVQTIAEAWVGLVIEVVLIQRLFGK